MGTKVRVKNVHRMSAIFIRWIRCDLTTLL